MALAVYSWGRGEDGQLGLGDTNDQYKPVLVDALKDKDVVQVACGSGHTVVLTDDGNARRHAIMLPHFCACSALAARSAAPHCTQLHKNVCVGTG